MQTSIPDSDFLTRDKFLNTLAESYVLHETILNSTELSVISTTREGIINSVNKVTEKSLGYDTEELIGKKSIVVIHDAEELAQRAQLLCEELGKPVAAGFETLVAILSPAKPTDRREWTYIRKDNSRYLVSLSVSGIWDERGELSGFLAIATDITEQKRADEELRQSKNHLQALVQSLDDIALEVDEHGRYLSLWTAREDLLFADREKYVGRKMSEMLTLPLAGRYEEAIGKVIKSGKPEFLEYPSIKPDVDQWYLAKITRLSAKSVLILVREITEQKKAELKLVESEQKFRLLAENVPGVIYLCRNDHTFSNIFISKNIEKISGYAVGDFLNGTIDIQHLIHPDDFHGAEKVFKKALEAHESYQLEYRIVHRSGEIKWLKESGAGLYGSHGLDLIEGYLSDITERKNAELALRDSEEKFRSLAENIPGAIYLSHNDEKYTIIYFNFNVEQLTGHKAEAFIAQEVFFADLIHPEDREEVFRKVNEAVVNKISFDVEYRIFHKDGTPRWVKDVGAGVYRTDGPPLLEGFVSDITEKKQAQHELEKVANENQRIFRYSPYLQCIAGFDGYFKKLNRVWERTLGWSVEELLARPFIEFIHPDDVSVTNEASDHLYGGTSLSSFENRYRCKDGSYRWLLWTSSTDVENQIIHASALDITERKKSEEELLFSKNNLEVAAHELQEQNRQLSEFAHIISHNLRSPVGNIQALIALLSKNSTIEEYQEVFKNLQKTSINLRETLNELLDILRVKKESTVERSTLKFSDVLTKAKQDLMGEIIHTNAKITSNFKACPNISYSKTYLESIVLNLLSNALKYRFPGRAPQIAFETFLANGHPTLKISDNGLGIDLEAHGGEIFGLRKVFHDHKEARGVGLFLTKTQLEAMGGKIWVESTVNVGSTFFIEF